jgi:predicted ArsR family transcriptional regulator
MDLTARATGIGALADDSRRALYEYVVAQREPVGRDQAAAGLGMARHNVSHHLDRLVEDGLLEVEFRRLSGRTGPGAGRPSKLYRRAEAEIAVSLPPRRYDLVGDILATAVTRTGEGVSLDDAIAQSAREEGLAVARSTGDPDAETGLGAVAAVLSTQGYEPRMEEDALLLANCPFDALAQRHTQLVCGVNRCFVQGVADGLGGEELVASLEPEPGQCCVKVREP